MVDERGLDIFRPKPPIDISQGHAMTATAVQADRYTRVAIILHWTIAALILFNIGLGYFMNSMSPAVRGWVISIHISSGMTVLILTAARILWRVGHQPPPHPADMRPWERYLAHLAHILLYALMVIMPVTGWAIISAHPPAGSAGAAFLAASKAAVPPPVASAPAAGRSVERPSTAPKRSIWGIVPIPMIAPVTEIGRNEGGVAPQKRLHEEFVSWHGLEGYLLLALLALHIAGALKHQLVDRHRELARMGIGRGRAADVE